jgi:hypothetical protein
MLQRRYHIVSDTPGVGYGLRRFRVIAYPVAAVNTAAQVFGKMAVNVAADFYISVLGFYYDSVHHAAPVIKARYCY